MGKTLPIVVLSNLRSSLQNLQTHLLLETSMYRRQFFLGPLAVATSASPFPAWSQQRPLLRISVSFGPGSPVDVLSRLIADKLKDSLGQTVVVENRAGAAGRIAAEYLKSAPADGNTLLAAPMMLPVLSPLTVSKLNFDPVADLVPVAMIASFFFGIAVRSDHPARDVREVIAWMKANPSRATFGSPASGSLPHFFGLLLGAEAGAPMVHVPYNTSGQLQIGLIGGDMPIAMDLVSGLVENHKAGKIRVLATSGPTRSTALPDIPTFAEQGYSKVVGSGWFGFFAPPKTAPADIARLNQAINEAMKAPNVRELLRTMALEPASGSPADLAAAIKRDTAQWGPIVKASGFRAD